MIDRGSELSVTRQARLLGICRGSVYYCPRPVSGTDLKLMERIDRLHNELPFAGSRMLQGLLKKEGFEVGRRHVATLMKRMAIEALYRRPNTSKPSPGHKIHPYLLRGLVINRPNQVWATDITYIPMARGFIYLTAVIDWFTRRVLSWRVSITMEAAFCIEALQEALARFGKPEIFNTDQGSQFTSLEFTQVLGVALARKTGCPLTLAIVSQQALDHLLEAQPDLENRCPLKRAKTSSHRCALSNQHSPLNKKAT